ncbi:hypothetical protein BC629DRAFT_1436668 [Irpex lacteus]|nr:hypothetical protein BC629DRAFT_1436668 [Irpex lacteus]
MAKYHGGTCIEVRYVDVFCPRELLSLCVWITFDGGATCFLYASDDLRTIHSVKLGNGITLCPMPVSQRAVETCGIRVHKGIDETVVEGKVISITDLPGDSFGERGRKSHKELLGKAEQSSSRILGNISKAYALGTHYPIPSVQLQKPPQLLRVAVVVTAVGGDLGGGLLTP